MAMSEPMRRILRWIPLFAAQSREGVPWVFGGLFYGCGAVLVGRAGCLAAIRTEPERGGPVEIAGISLLLMTLYAGAVIAQGNGRGDRSVRNRLFRRRFEANRMAVAGLGLLLFLVCAAVMAPLLTNYDPIAQPHPALEQYLPPSTSHPMGTDKFGRDVLSRVLYGARVSLSIGIGSVILASLLGIVIGAFSGYRGGRIDSLVMRFVDGCLAFPRLLLVLTLVAFFSNSSILIVGVLAGTGWMGIARLVRAEVISLKTTEFIEAAAATGLAGWRIIWNHLIPNALGPALVAATLKIGSLILLESSLSFLGLGIQPPLPSWGAMVFAGREVLLTAWWVGAFPALAIVISVMACNLLGDGLRDALDVRTPINP
jgi:peptide/nickel transport system permease protein